MPTLRRPRADFWSGLALAALGAWIATQAQRWTYIGVDGPGAGFFPFWYGLAMAALSLVLVVRSVLVRAAEDAARTRWRDAARALVCWAALVASVALVKPLGFVASFALLVVFVVAAMFRRPWWHAALFALAGALLFHVVFDVALGVPLPRPRWPF